MTTNQATTSNPRNWVRVVGGGLAAGLTINAFEYGVHRIYLDDAWSAAFHALGKTPTGWSAFIPGNFLIGILLVWLYARLRGRYGSGTKTALRSALAVWVVFWAVPLLSFVPMNLFPNRLLAIAILLGVVDVTLAGLLGAWIYRDRLRP